MPTKITDQYKQDVVMAYVHLCNEHAAVAPFDSRQVVAAHYDFMGTYVADPRNSRQRKSQLWDDVVGIFRCFNYTGQVVEGYDSAYYERQRQNLIDTLASELGAYYVCHDALYKLQTIHSNDGYAAKLQAKQLDPLTTAVLLQYHLNQQPKVYLEKSYRSTQALYLTKKYFITQDLRGEVRGSSQPLWVGLFNLVRDTSKASDLQTVIEMQLRIANAREQHKRAFGACQQQPPANSSSLLSSSTGQTAVSMGAQVTLAPTLLSLPALKPKPKYHFSK